MAKHISVKGVVQGVGFRPFVYGLATGLDLHGWVCNTSGGVDTRGWPVLEISKSLFNPCLLKALLAKIDPIQVDEAPCHSSSGFEIHCTQNVEGAYQPISPDMAIVRIANANCSIRKTNVIYTLLSIALIAARGLPLSRIFRMIAQVQRWRISPCAIIAVQSTPIP